MNTFCSWHQSKNAQEFYKCGAWLKPVAFNITIADFQGFSFSKSTKLEIRQTCIVQSVMGLIKEVSKHSERISHRKNIILTVLKWGSAYSEANVTLGDDDNNHGCTGDSIGNGHLLQRGFGDRKFGRTQCGRFTTFFGRYDQSDSFALVLLSFLCYQMPCQKKEKNWNLCNILRQRH